MEKLFDVLPVRQKDSTFYLSSVKAGELSGLCSGLRLSPARKANILSESISTEGDADKLVNSLTNSAFAKEVMDAQQSVYDDDEPYQRLLDKSRAQDIANYLAEEDALLPNSVILAAREDVEATFDAKTGKLKFSWDVDEISEPFNIIDGQHRIEALKLLAAEKSDFKEFEVAITILLDLPFYAQAELFAVVNGRQKPVSRSRVYDLLGYLPIVDTELKRKAYVGEMALHRFCHHAVKVLNTSSKSPWTGRIKMRGTGEGIVTQAAFVDHMAYYMIAKKDRPGMRYLPVLYPFYKNADLVGLARLLVIYFVGVSQAKPDFWTTDERLKTSLFGKTNGIAVFFSVFHDSLVCAGGYDNFTVDFVKSNWRKVPDEIIAKPPPGGSKGYQAEVTGKVLTAMFGEKFEEEVRGKIDGFKSVLRNVGGLLIQNK